jgi:hypothetical protein
MTNETFIPSREIIQSLKVGDKALNVWGNWAEVTSIYAQKDNIHGKAFVCFYTKDGSGTISASYEEGRIVRTLPLCKNYNSAQLDAMEHAQ